MGIMNQEDKFEAVVIGSGFGGTPIWAVTSGQIPAALVSARPAEMIMKMEYANAN